MRGVMGLVLPADWPVRSNGRKEICVLDRKFTDLLRLSSFRQNGSCGDGTAVAFFGMRRRFVFLVLDEEMGSFDIISIKWIN
ncbi:hypothetical protein TRFO_14750 [Tritrichomonas foetus]|uniref:Uncharacterized protein n=1 Tax=Tritrichomonas foetus TaxID=1144522 RepID=A0A1J4KUK2_9EUKA|nr:hypothetical protein TRFO_14750 [Tritrichomonas foetus]|eukprot:OHT14818.1 hypothetical protein TRFO_14750 [Tritrichomonas foetus]